jgi:5-oxoprolinase (ATP-hydrolysing)
VGEVVERVGAHGELHTPLDEASAVSHLQEAYDAGIRSVAVVFMHGYRYDSHERRVAELAKEMGFTQVRCVYVRRQ